ncbi:twin-arginine translocase subunit TatC [bacterium]|nr:twin-arginine translocase subunit TatC [candidate division CSSED10-310 bacterium]
MVSDRSPQQLDPRGEMPILAHLEDIRRRLIRCLTAIIVCALIAMCFSEELFRWIAAPLIAALPHSEDQMVFTSLPEVFVVYLKIGLFAGFIAAMPYVLFQIWQFFVLGLYPTERSRVIAFVTVSTSFFLAGAAFCYYQVFPWGFRFFIGFSSDSIVPMITMKEYLKFAIRLLLAFGLIFEMPVMSAFLAMLGVLTPEYLKKKRHYAIVIIFTVAAFLTPPDVVTQLLMAAPMLVLYELSILSAALFRRT